MRNWIAAFAVVLALAFPARATVTSPTSSITYTCTGGTVYAIPFSYLAASHVIATQKTGAATTTVIGTVKPSVAPTTGTLTLGTACQSGSTLTITRSVPLTQPTSFRTGAYSGAAHEAAFDRLEMQIQQLGATTTALSLIASATQSGILSSADWIRFNGTAFTSLNQFQQVGTGAIARPIADKLAEVITAKDFGAKGDGTTDDAGAITAACAAVGVGREVTFPAGTYRIATAASCAAQIKLAKGATLAPVAGVAFTTTGAIINDNGFQNFNENAVSFPSDFPATGLTFTRDSVGAYSSSFDPDAYATSWGITRTLFVNPLTGNDSTGTGLVGAPYLTVTKAIDIAIAAPESFIQITIVTGGVDVLLNRDVFIGGGATKVISGKRLYITPDNTTKKVYVSNTQTGLSWTLNTGATYQAARSNVTHVLDMGSKDAFGIPLAYTFRSSIATVDANPGSWWTDGTTVYVRTLAGAIPVAGTHIVQVGLALVRFNLGASAELYLRNLYMLGGLSHTALIQNVTSDYTANKLVCYNCAFTYSNPLFAGGTGNNGLIAESVKTVHIFNSVAAYNSADGFNFHYTRGDPASGAVRGYYALVFGSNSYNNGLGDVSSTQNTNNAYTSHEGANFACVACNGWNTQGALFAFVNGINSVLIGSTARLSANTVSTAGFHTAYYFDNSTAPAGVVGKAYLDDCEGNDTNFDLNSDGSVPITLRDFVGTKISAAAFPLVRWLPTNGIGSRTQSRMRGGAVLSPVAGVMPAPLANMGSGFAMTPVTFSNLGTPANFTVLPCSDCTIANPCAGGGTGALAKRLNGVWVCN